MIFWPVDVATSWLADDTMVMAAMAGTSVGPSVYDELDRRMTRAPRGVPEAYEQATYFVALGARRAMREGNEAAADVLLSELDGLLAEGESVRGEVGWTCSITGYGCPRGGSVRVLGDAIRAVDESGLNPDDALQLRSFLVRNRNSLIVRRAIPVVAVLAGSIALGSWLRHRP